MGAINKMKILVCSDGSPDSRKALEKAAEIAAGQNIDQVAVIHIDEQKHDISTLLPLRDGYRPSEQDLEHLKKLNVDHRKEKAEKIFQEAIKVFAEKNIEVGTIFEQGHPAKTILDIAQDQGFDMIFVGGRGMSGWKKRILGSVSGAIANEAKNVCVVVAK